MFFGSLRVTSLRVGDTVIDELLQSSPPLPQGQHSSAHDLKLELSARALSKPEAQNVRIDHDDVQTFSDRVLHLWRGYGRGPMSTTCRYLPHPTHTNMFTHPTIYLHIAELAHGSAHHLHDAAQRGFMRAGLFALEYHVPSQQIFLKHFSCCAKSIATSGRPDSWHHKSIKFAALVSRSLNMLLYTDVMHE